MDPNSKKPKPEPEQGDHPSLKVIRWEDYEQELARFLSLSSASKEACHKKHSLQCRLQSLIQVQAESLYRKNELDEISQRLEDRKLVMGNMLMQAKVVEEHVKTKEEHLGSEIKSLLVSGTSLSAARKRLQDSDRLLSGERGYGRLTSMQKLLRARQQYMISQVSYLYPVKTSIGASEELELDLYHSGSRETPGESAADQIKQRDQGVLTISGAQLSMFPFTQMTFFPDKKQLQRSTSSLGYIAHAISLAASYLLVPLRYPVRLGGSHSYVKDYAPCAEPSSSGSSSAALVSNNKCLEFPLFLDGQDVTRAAYAIFLLNKQMNEGKKLQSVTTVMTSPDGEACISLLVQNLRQNARAPRGSGFVQFVNPVVAADAKHRINALALQSCEPTFMFAENRKKPTDMRAWEWTRVQHCGR